VELRVVAEIIDFPEQQQVSRHVVLVVDDEFLVRTVLSEILKDAGFHVLQAETAHDAIAILEHPSQVDHVDLVFSDVKMPDMDGFELARWVTEHKTDMPVILASGYIGKTSMASELRCAEVLKKPFDFDTVINKIRDTISRRQARLA
jgi:DNA-binding NtrC family response regulator